MIWRYRRKHIVRHFVSPPPSNTTARLPTTATSHTNQETIQPVTTFSLNRLSDRMIIIQALLAGGINYGTNGNRNWPSVL
mmetsp:Transcript_51555/g.62126  ORF Transcript_51555/g.62126 Transcript_51555/m.62126 type:complete len:80 (+) Transcript_51555:95-334(+)